MGNRSNATIIVGLTVFERQVTPGDKLSIPKQVHNKNNLKINTRFQIFHCRKQLIISHLSSPFLTRCGCQSFFLCEMASLNISFLQTILNVSIKIKMKKK